jgi:zinc/manganese transport system substrate-binding protein
MRNPRAFWMALAAGGWAAGAAAAAPLRVTATLSTLADLVQTVGGEHVVTSFVAPPAFNPHFIEPRPSDVLMVKSADLFVHVGLDLEAWRGPLVDAAANRRVRPGGDRELDLSRGIDLLEVPTGPVSRSEGDIHLFGNPHYWTSPVNARIMAQTIADTLCALDPAHAGDYQSNLRTFHGRLDARLEEWRSRLAPYRDRALVGYHNEWLYLTEFAGLKMEMFLEPKPGIPPGPRHLVEVERYIREHDVRAVVSATYQPRRPLEDIARRTGVRIALLCQNVGERPAASDYIAMVDYNVEQLVRALER